MKRREFIIKSGMMVTATMLANNWTAEASAAIVNHNGKTIKDRRPGVNQYLSPILKAITYGINAPNPHNTQAWKFKIIDNDEALFFVDESRILLATDPYTRQIQIGCGCFIALLRIGASKLGYRAIVNILPDGAFGPDEIGNKPVAQLKLEKITINTDPLFNQIFRRQTNRTPYKGKLITSQEFSDILSLTLAKGSRIDVVNTKEELKSLLLLLYKGMEVECYDYDAYDESLNWFRVHDDIAVKKDGLNLRTNGVSGIKLWIAEYFLSSYSKKMWHNEGSILSYLRSHYNAVMNSKGIVTFKTENNNQLDWIKCGEDYARFQLAATQLGFYIHPLSQVLQEFPSMKELYNEFNTLMNVQTPQKIQMAVRIGRGGPTVYSYRRNTGDTII